MLSLGRHLNLSFYCKFQEMEDDVLTKEVVDIQSDHKHELVIIEPLSGTHVHVFQSLLLRNLGN